MCILAIAWRAHPRWLLVAAANRDERHDRIAARLGRWVQPDHIIAGKDLQSGGTWLGVSEQGRFAAITNVRNPDGPKAGLSSRGALVTDFLAGAGRYADPANVEPADFNPYNLVLAEGDQAWFQSNRPKPTRRMLEHGVYGLANGGLDDPWRKTLELKAAMREWMDAGAQHPKHLLDALSRESPEEPVATLSLSSEDTPEPSLTPIFIRDPIYGTRCSTVVAIDTQGRGLVIERSFTPEGKPAGETSLSFSWPLQSR